MKDNATSKQIIIASLETRLNKIRLECNSHIADSRALLAKMFMSEVGLEEGQVVNHNGELYVICSVQLNPNDRHGIAIEISRYSDGTSYPEPVSPSAISW